MDFRDSNRTLDAVSYAPFAAAAVLAWLTVLVGSSINWPEYVLASVLLALTGVLRLTGVMRSRWGAAIPSLVFLAAVGLLRNSAGGISSGAGAIPLITVFYTALYSTGRRDLWIVLVALSAFYLVPILLVGSPSYPNTQYRAALLSVFVASIIGLATQRLVASVRVQAGEARNRERMLEEVSDVLRDLFGSSQARVDVCEAAKRIGEATVAILYEPVPGSQLMRSSAIVGLDAASVEVSLQKPSAVREAFLTGQAELITENVVEHVGNRELWESGGQPGSILYEPLLRGSEPIGVLVVGWADELRAPGPRAAVVKLLAHEAAAVITRADVLKQLTDLSATDPLTGLPNRRTWDARVRDALSRGQRFTIAMLDLDHFKQYNDTYGHPAGDVLLQETASMWLQQLRAGDLLARLGGEEFGLLLMDCDTPDAVDVIERLRGAIYAGRTCSAGFAARRRGEPAEDVMARADAALYEAKTSGRDRACMSV